MGNVQVFQLIERKQLYGSVLPQIEKLMNIDDKVCDMFNFDFFIFIILISDHCGYVNESYGSTSGKISFFLFSSLLLNSLSSRSHL